ncbi:hypothetical protein ABB37_02833 [Leptomonas pyrrhocoris]|uniref:Palmitoyltransferase n=1 Tax=Leptomonas pyrrhocoris TaxID=157538 RepID=A0A0N0DXL8_LEPPY|nr:hypothetical protein ABB37_02833 [Leptomonas pyrrhocoris]KPA83135.1 hypothetical protein ABB37_02833 [Leptomonas pyrrhocoris]|eukprot:XP_015661574.1 hypothetical protein ABB37_02833 [Leptomonas pyrrhocoris]
MWNASFSSNSAVSAPHFHEESALSTPDSDVPSLTHSRAPVGPAPPAAPPVSPSPRRGPPGGSLSHALDHPGVAAASANAPAVCRRLSDRGTERVENRTSSDPQSKPASGKRVMANGPHARAHHQDVHAVLAPEPSWQPMPRVTPVAAASDTNHESDASAEGPSAGVALNPLRRECTSDDVTSPSGSKSSGDGSSNSESGTRMTKESVVDDAVLDSSGAGGAFSLTSIVAPRTAEEYYEQVAKIDHVRCGLGQELEGDAKDVYGPTWPFSKRMLATMVVGHRECLAPNCDHKAPLQAVTGPQIWSLLFIYGVLFLYPVFTTVAYAGKKGWGGIIPLWVLSCVTAFFVTLCSFTNPGIVPRRRLKNVTDRGDILIVRVPAPNAQAVLNKLQELPELASSSKSKDKYKAAATRFTTEAIHQALVDGDIPPSVFNHKRTAVYSMERYFETDTGHIVPYNPVLSESDLAVPTLEFPILFCRTCRIARGPRTHHCRVCNNCVDGMDHHCRWTNCCIGRNNYPYFFMTLLSLHVMGGYSVLYNLIQAMELINHHKSWTLWQVLRHVYGMPIIVYACFFFIGLFFFPLFLGHIYMTMMGLTTNELLKKKWTESTYFCGVNPWSHKHWWLNVYSRLLKKWPATPDDPLKWMDSRYYYGVAVAAAVEDQKVDWLIALPPEERTKVEERAAAQRDDDAKARPAQERAIIEEAMRRRELHVAGE